MTRRARWRLIAVLALVADTAVAADATVDRPAGIAGCGAPPELIALGAALPRVASRIERRETMTVVALGSSSTQGTGASGPDKSYPSRLEVELKARFPGLGIRVINRGRGGEEAPQMLARIERDVLAEQPDLVIWQLGTNAVLRHDDVAYEEPVIEQGLARLRNGGADVVLMDMQYAPRVLARPASPAMERLIAGAAKREHVGLFRRFAIMQSWRAAEPPGSPAAVGPDGLHMNDRGYGCLAADLAEAVAASWRLHEAAAQTAGAAQWAGLAVAEPALVAP